MSMQVLMQEFHTLTTRLGTIAMLGYALAVFSFMHFYFKWDNKKKLRGDYDHLVEGMTEEEANELGERNPRYLLVDLSTFGLGRSGICD